MWVRLWMDLGVILKKGFNVELVSCGVGGCGEVSTFGDSVVGPSFLPLFALPLAFSVWLDWFHL